LDSWQLGSSTASTFLTHLRSSRRGSLEGSLGGYILWKGAVTDSWSSISYKKITGLGMSSKGTSRSEPRTDWGFSHLTDADCKLHPLTELSYVRIRGAQAYLFGVQKTLREPRGRVSERGITLLFACMAHWARVLLMVLYAVMIIYLARTILNDCTCMRHTTSNR
jgi:hypothetical protein